MLEFIKQYLTTVIGALTITSAVYLIFWVIFGKIFGDRKIQLSKRAGWSQLIDEIAASLISFIGTTAFMLIVFYFKDHGLTKLYIGNEIGIYEILSILIMILISDTWFYWCHRAMHLPSIYKYVHALHHKSLDVNPFTSTSFHMIESIILTIWVLPLVLIMPLSITALGIVQVIGTFNNIKSHLGYEFFPAFFGKIPPFNFLVNATNHSLHHTQYNGNYGLFFRFWDIVCKTELNTTQITFDEIHQRNNEKIIKNTQYRPLIIDKLVKENPYSISVYFKPLDTDFYNYIAGQYLTIKVKVDNKTYTRCFSLSSSPRLDEFLRITIKLKGAVSNYFYHTAKVGDYIESLLPVGDFILIPKSEVENNYVMIAGGSGITPLLSMINQILHFEPKSHITLLYANKTKENILFGEELNNFEEIHPNFKYKKFISGQSRIDKNDLINKSNTQFFICGPNSLKEGIISYLNDLKVSKSNIHVEHFVDGYTPWFGLLRRKQRGNS